MKRWILWVFVLPAWLHGGEIYATFEVEAAQESTLVLGAMGVVDSLHVKVGDYVKKGDLLLNLGSLVEAADEALAQSSVALAARTSGQADAEFERYKGLEGVVDTERYERMRFAKEKAVLELNEARGLLNLKQAVYAQKQLYAPYDGVISHVHVEVGEGTNGPMSPLVTLHAHPKVKLVFRFDQRHWGSVKAGQRVVYRVDGEEKTREGIIDNVYPSVDASRRSLGAEVFSEGILPGLFGDGKIMVP